MVVERAAEAKLVFAKAAYCWYDAAEIAGFDRTVDSVLAVGCRAPTKVILIIHIRPGEKRAIPMGSIKCQSSFSKPQELLRRWTYLS
jgi:hypothetical protein